MSFAMLTINCDEHPLLNDRWLDASLDEAPGFFSTFGSDDLLAHAAPPPPRARTAPSPPSSEQRELL